MKLRDILFRKQRQIEAQVFVYLDLWQECLEAFESAMHAYLEKGLSEEFRFIVDRMHRAESQADDQRRKIEYEMYARALLPESRGDILGLLEALDTVPGGAQAVLFSILHERIDWPATLTGEMRELVNGTCEATTLLLGLARGVFTGSDDRFRVSREIDAKESRCDHFEGALIGHIFSSAEFDRCAQLQLRDLVVKLSEISDRAENVSDRIMIMSLKRKV